MFLIRIFAYLPFPILHGLSSFLAWVLDKVVKYRRKVVVENLQHAFPEKSPHEISRLRKAFYLNFTDTWLETLKLLELSEKKYRKRIEILNPELPTRLVKEGKTVMVLSSHRSAWEWLTPATDLMLKVPIDAVYQRVRSPFFNQLMEKIRGRFGARMVEKKELLRDTLQRRDVPRLLAIMYDQSPHKPLNCHWFSFMNRLSPFYMASEKLARKLNTPVLYADLSRVKRGYYQARFLLITEDPRSLPEDAITREYVRLIEEGIRREPAAYLWSHRRWKHSAPADLQARKKES